ncbi:MAG TPA: hypothetical protein VFH88_07410 [Candidatus Krumholzibacteria bacterium]|nr:hypothetical protein [Candidatus Krumholzibacteria bacterium]
MSPVVRRTIALMVLGCLLAQAAGCSSTHMLPVNTVLTEKESKIAGPPGLEIAGYMTTDGVRHRFDGTVTLEDSVFVFHPDKKAAAAADSTSTRPTGPFSLGRTEVASLDAYQHSHTLLIIGVCAAIAAGFVWLGESLTGN